MPRNDWTYKEHILAFNLYCTIPFTKINERYPPIRELAKILGRSDGAVSRKMANFARLDPVLKARNVSGLTHGAKGEEEVWNEFTHNWNHLAYESEKILAEYKGIPIEANIDSVEEPILVEGYSREALLRIRVNQHFFRKSVLSSYNFKCCISGLAVSELLVAGHIVPWSVDVENRTNPSNGLSLNSLFDKAYDRGLITVTPDYEIIVCEELREKERKHSTELFLPFHLKKNSTSAKVFPQERIFRISFRHYFR